MLHHSHDFPPPELPPRLPRAPGRDRFAADCATILVPTELSDGEAPAITMGWELAAARQARLTLLSVMPSPPALPPDAHPDDSVHWLEGIERLYAALDHLSLQRATLLRMMQTQLQAAQEQLNAFCERQIPPRIRERVDIQLEVRTGDFASEVQTFIATQPVDLVILTSRLSWWRLPLVPSKTHRLLQGLRTQFLVVSPDASSSPAKRPGSQHVAPSFPSPPIQTR